jgi:bilirubin oxidase
MLSRRQLVKLGLVTGTAAVVPSALQLRTAGAAVPGGTLDPTSIPKYVTPLFIPPAMPLAGTASGGSVDVYSVGARRFSQQVLPSGFPRTTVFGYGSANNGATFSWPAPTIEATVNRQVRVTWANQLTSNGRFVPPLVTVDPTLHWANPPGGNAGRDSHGGPFTSTPPPYQGPVPLVTHLHGAHTFDDSDGYPEAWTLPAANNIPNGWARVGSFWDQFRQAFQRRTGVNWNPGTSVYQYRNDQRATQLWYHDHVLGMTRVNIYSGLAGFYNLRGGSSDLPAGVLPGPAPARGDATGVRYHEIPLMIQCRSFNRDGSLFFPTSRDFFGDVPAGGPYIPNTDIPPYWNPEFFGNTMAVNGRTWPTLTVEPRRYRFRIVNASNTRVLMLKVVSNPLAARPVTPTLPIWAIGSDGGFLPRPVQLQRVVAAPAERHDVIIDFTGLRPGTKLFMINEGPDEPFGGGEPDQDFDVADPQTTGQVMQFVVGTLAGTDTSTPPSQLRLPSFTPVGAANRTRQVSLNELTSNTGIDAPVLGALGTLNSDGSGHPIPWEDPLTEHPALNATEVWEMHNFTEDGHPIHIHLVQFQIVNRQPFGGTARGPEADEIGFKDTVIALPGEITRVRAKFDVAGRYVWHCHIIDHEDNEMMRPYQIG